MSTMNSTIDAVRDTVVRDGRSCSGCGHPLPPQAACCGRCGTKQSGLVGKLMGRYYLIRRCLTLAILWVILMGGIISGWQTVIWPSLQSAREHHGLIGAVVWAVFLAYPVLALVKKIFKDDRPNLHQLHQRAKAAKRACNSEVPFSITRANRKILRYNTFLVQLPEKDRQGLQEIDYCG